MPAGRPSLGLRRQCNVRLLGDLIDEIDAARGVLSRDAWFDRAARLALRPHAQVMDTELLQETHEHQFLPHSTTYNNQGKRVRIKLCACGQEERS